jgi:hypothetical protein
MSTLARRTDTITHVQRMRQLTPFGLPFFAAPCFGRVSVFNTSCCVFNRTQYDQMGPRIARSTHNRPSKGHPVCSPWRRLCIFASRISLVIHYAGRSSHEISNIASLAVYLSIYQNENVLLVHTSRSHSSASFIPQTSICSKRVFRLPLTAKQYSLDSYTFPTSVAAPSS